MALTKQMRSTEVIRVVQSVTAGLQATLAVAGIADVIGSKVVLVIMAIVAGTQVALATWNQGLHNEPDPNPEYSPKP